jgi:hypothetical protein
MFEGFFFFFFFFFLIFNFYGLKYNPVLVVRGGEKVG